MSFFLDDECWHALVVFAIMSLVLFAGAVL